MELSIKELLKEMVEKGASDLHLSVGSSPRFRIDGELELTDYPALTPDAAKLLVYSTLNDMQKKELETTRELDFSFGIPGLSRFRANVLLDRGSIGMAIRTIPYQIIPMEELGLPPVVFEFTKKPKGLILVTGPTGSGKSTTLASMISRINEERKGHIITVEDPIEYVFRHNESLVRQRQVGSDTKSFANALKHVLREDPDIVMIGEMRDLDTFQAALTIAETGHLTFATLHTNSAPESITRIIDFFPVAQQPQVRAQLSFVLEGVITQQLIPKIGGGRVMSSEVMVATPALRALIRDDKVEQVYSIIQSGAKFGMQTMNNALTKLVKSRQITRDTALGYSTSPQELERMLI
jgi:twitching motility protein PilT